MKKTVVYILFIILFIILILSPFMFGSNEKTLSDTIQELSDNYPENNNVSGSEILIDKVVSLEGEEELSSTNDKNTYLIGIDIPSGVYTIVSDGSGFSSITIISDQSNETAKPKILITARYQANTRNYIERDLYVIAITLGGGIPIQPLDDDIFHALLSNNNVEATELSLYLAEQYDGLLLTGGGDIAAHFFGQEHHPAANTPDEQLDEAELALCRAFINVEKPVLGICRGMQIMNVTMGGDLIQDIPALLNIPYSVHFDSRHNIDILPDTWLYELFGSQTEVISRHHQSIGHVAEGFTIAAIAGDVVEAIEYGDLLGVQFHPEQMTDEGMLVLFEDFIERCCAQKASFTKRFTDDIEIAFYEGQYVEIMNAYIYGLG